MRWPSSTLNPARRGNCARAGEFARPEVAKTGQESSRLLGASVLGASVMPSPSGGHQLIGRQLHSARGVGAKAGWPLGLLRV